jgi:excisionase family DNA binding protein
LREAASDPFDDEPTSALDDLMTADELARCLKIPKSTVLEYQRRGVLPSIILGKHVRFVRSDVEAAILALTRRGRRDIGALA